MESVGRHRQVLFSFERTNSQQFFENYIEEESKKDFIENQSCALKETQKQEGQGEVCKLRY